MSEAKEVPSDIRSRIDEEAAEILKKEPGIPKREAYSRVYRRLGKIYGADKLHCIIRRGRTD